MNLGLKFKKQLHPIEIAALVIFFIYLVFPIRTPKPLANVMNSFLGVILVVGITIFLFLNTHPAVAILYIFVAYELIRRSGSDEYSILLKNSQPNVSPAATSAIHTSGGSTLQMNEYNDEVLQSELTEYDHNLSNYDNEPIFTDAPFTDAPLYEIITSAPLQHSGYATIGENSKVVSNERAAELARFNPPPPNGNTLEEEMIQERAPEVAARVSSVNVESSVFQPVYDKGSNGAFL
jgi:hypothetical protein